MPRRRQLSQRASTLDDGDDEVVARRVPQSDFERVKLDDMKCFRMSTSSLRCRPYGSSPNRVL